MYNHFGICRGIVSPLAPILKGIAMHKHAFTLIEILVTIVIILILLSIAATVIPWALRNSEIQNTQTTLKNAALILQEYEIELNGSAASTADLVANVKNSSLKTLLGAFHEKAFDGNTLRDMWGNEVVLVKAGTTPAGAPHKQSADYFFSYGPDGKASTLEDNLYSYEVGK